MHWPNKQSTMVDTTLAGMDLEHLLSEIENRSFEMALAEDQRAIAKLTTGSVLRGYAKAKKGFVIDSLRKVVSLLAYLLSNKLNRWSVKIGRWAK